MGVTQATSKPRTIRGSVDDIDRLRRELHQFGKDPDAVLVIDLKVEDDDDRTYIFRDVQKYSSYGHGATFIGYDSEGRFNVSIDASNGTVTVEKL